jgi:hypothetical protein
MPKRHKDLQDLELSDFKKTYGEAKVIDTIDMARLMHPQKYRYAHQPRLNRRVTNSAVKCLGELSRIIQFVPDSYKAEIMTSRSMQDFHLITVNGPSMKNRQKGKLQDFDAVAFNHYSQLLVNGISGVIATMPEDFRGLLHDQITPFLATMQSITSFAKASNPNTRIPQFRIPSDLWSIPEAMKN